MVRMDIDPAEASAIIDDNAYMTLATADGRGVPWASPVWFAHEGYTEFLWASRPGARHSRNIAERAEVGIVVFDSTVPIGKGRAVYMEATAGAVPDRDIARGIETFSRRSQAQGGAPWTAADVTGDAQHRLYRAVAARHFLLDERDHRVPVDLGGSE
jgi:nitroimidazol reductase NimA-like FMN-containing flavoprotein (pyridoxamine 5'-phosphate oxidase superfamily)